MILPIASWGGLREGGITKCQGLVLSKDLLGNIIMNNIMILYYTL